MPYLAKANAKEFRCHTVAGTAVLVKAAIADRLFRNLLCKLEPNRLPISQDDVHGLAQAHLTAPQGCGRIGAQATRKTCNGQMPFTHLLRSR
jgi:hypothetical protein